MWDMSIKANIRTRVRGFPKDKPKRYIITIPKTLIDTGVLDPSEEYEIIISEKEEVPANE